MKGRQGVFEKLLGISIFLSVSDDVNQCPCSLESKPDRASMVERKFSKHFCV